VNIEKSREHLDRRQLLGALRSLRRGDFAVRLPEDLPGVDTEIAKLFNDVVSLNEDMATELERLSVVVGKEGKINQRGRVKNATGGWETAIRSVNDLIEDMVQPTAEVARVIGAGRQGRPVAVDDGRDRRPPAARRVPAHRQGGEHHGRAARLFASEVTRVAREVGTEGKLGGQAKVQGVAGTWKDLTDNVNAMATNLTGQVRNIAEVTTAVRLGRLVQEDHRSR
jgi:hypothetical protein